MDVPWHPSPRAGVWRKSLYREGGEFGPVTSLVRYDAGAIFPSHPHPGGEEILVLSGVFSDEYGDYPAGTHILNPEGFVHAPNSKYGCLILVHLQQFGGSGRSHMLNNADALPWQSGSAGVHHRSLYEQNGFMERISIQRWDQDTCCLVPASPGFTEVFVLSGVLSDDEGDYQKGTWLRIPESRHPHTFFTRPGCEFYLRLHSSLGKICHEHA